MKIEVNLPVIIDVRGSSDFENVESTLKIVIPNVKVKELGYDVGYIGVAYLDKITKPTIRKLLGEKGIFIKGINIDPIKAIKSI